MKELIAQGVRTYDFLGGETGYKAKWGAQAGHYLDLRFARPFSVGAAYLQAQRCTERSKAWLRRNLPGTAWKMLRRINASIGRTGKQTDPAGNAVEEGTAQDPKLDRK